MRVEENRISVVVTRHGIGGLSHPHWLKVTWCAAWLSTCCNVSQQLRQRRTQGDWRALKVPLGRVGGNREETGSKPGGNREETGREPGGNREERLRWGWAKKPPSSSLQADVITPDGDTCERTFERVPGRHRRTWGSGSASVCSSGGSRPPGSSETVWTFRSRPPGSSRSSDAGAGGPPLCSCRCRRTRISDSGSATLYFAPCLLGLDFFSSCSYSNWK